MNKILMLLAAIVLSAYAGDDKFKVYNDGNNGLDGRYIVVCDDSDITFNIPTGESYNDESGDCGKMIIKNDLGETFEAATACGDLGDGVTIYYIGGDEDGEDAYIEDEAYLMVKRSTWVDIYVYGPDKRSWVRTRINMVQDSN